ncbi:hypothetical protein IAT38_004421 [Cryptococcus sp. DSM 104549]
MAPSHLPPALSPEYWSTWQPQQGKTALESLVQDDSEEWIGGWDDVGLYEGNNKIPAYQSLSVQLTSHRLILLPNYDTSSTSTSSTPPPPALTTHLSYVRQTEFYTGFMRSSAKITLILGTPPAALPPGSNAGGNDASSSTGVQTHGEGEGWTCRVCGFLNAPNGLARASKCGLCGMAWAQAAGAADPASGAGSVPGSGGPSRSGTPLGGVNGIGGVGSGSGSQEGAGDKNPPKQIACPACTFLNSPLLQSCEICLTPLPKPPRSGSALAATPQPPPSAGKREIVRLSFRKGGEKVAYQKMKSVLGDKAWERERDGVRGGASSGSRQGNASGTVRSGAGIDGILQQMDLSARAQDEHMQSAFADLEALMLRAGEMVRLAQSLNSKLTQQQASASASSGAGLGTQPTEEETTMIRTSLVQLGLAAPALTKEMVRTEKAYFEGLAKELGGLLTGRGGEVGGGLMVGEKGRGVLGLDEVWGLWMRARGVALLPPSTLIDTLPYLPEHTTPPIYSLTLPSSLVVLHTPAHSTSTILSRTLDRLAPGFTESTAGETPEEKSFSALEFAALESLPIGLATEFIGLMEAQGGLVRDEQAGQAKGGVRWYRDIIAGWGV